MAATKCMNMNPALLECAPELEREHFSSVRALLQNPLQEKVTLRTGVPSSVDVLDCVHRAVGWTPGPQSIRPDPETISNKKIQLEHMSANYQSYADFILNTVFELPARRGGDGRRGVPDSAVVGNESRFVSNPYPYQGLAEDTRHYVMWYALDTPCPAGADMHSLEGCGLAWHAVNRDIEAAVTGLGGDQFIWYVNPKPSVADGRTFHVQVFWR